jgi:hypothetical protein
MFMALFYKRGAEGSEISCYHFNRNPNTPLHLPIESGQALPRRGIFSDGPRSIENRRGLVSYFFAALCENFMQLCVI